jgi:hypothetical protein
MQKPHHKLLVTATYLLLLSNVIAQGLGFSDDSNGGLILKNVAFRDDGEQ